MPKRKVDWQSKNSEQIHKFEIEIEYVHNLKELYKRLHFWLEDRGWKDLWDMDNYEVRYWQRDLPGGSLHEHHIWWRAWKTPSSNSNDSNDFFKYVLKIDYQTIAAGRQEVMHKGQKWKLDSSNTILRVQSHLILDWAKGWDKGLMSGFKQQFQHWIYKDKIDKERENLFKLTVDFQNAIKDFLEIAKDKEQEPSIYPPNMLP